MEIIHFQDVKNRPDFIHVYSSCLREDLSPIIINNGSYQCRAGWVTDTDPILVFKNHIAKPRKERSKPNKDGIVEVPQQPQLQVGNNIPNVEAVRFQLKTPFDRNVVTHFEAQEHLFDYTFTRLNIDTENRVPHPILITEPPLNPNASRSLMSELLFECYDVPTVSYGIDSLFAYANSCSEEVTGRDALLISLGYHTVHVIPIINGDVKFHRVRRLNTGGHQIISFLHRILQLKYPSHTNSITLSRSEEILRRICSVALDYKAEIVKWEDLDYYQSHIRRIQLPYVQNVPNTLSAEQQKERKRELARRLTEINARKREERLAEYQTKWATFDDMDALRHVDNDEFERLLTEHGLRDVHDLHRNITQLNVRIDTTKQKIAAAANAALDDGSACVEEAAAPPPAKQPKYTKLVFENDKARHDYVQNAMKMKDDILRKKACRKQRKQDMAKRRTAAGQERMRIISQLARKEKGNDDFGLRDEDWDIYKTISRDGGDSDSDTENDKLTEIDELIREHEPNQASGSSIHKGLDDGQPGYSGKASSSMPSLSTAEIYQLHIGVEQFRAPELLFKPYMAGSTEGGLTDLIEYVLSQFSLIEQLRLASNVVLDGGLANLPGLKERLSADLMSIRPCNSFHQVTVLNEPSMAGWYGARKFADSPAFASSQVTRQEYNEFGGEYFKMHFASNPYTASPKQEVVLEFDDF